MTRFAIVFLLGISLASPVLATSLAGRVIRVQDGNSLTIQADGRAVRVRLEGIDAPELKQAYGPESQRSLADLCFDKESVAEYRSKDSDGRPLVQIRCAGVDANAEQVQRGMAWVDKRHTNSASPLHFMMDQAQRSREGLWSDRSPVAPWIWRRGKNRR
jgi:endonuclease YncB( thermonuclease family)